MRAWPAAKAATVLRALHNIGWSTKRQSGKRQSGKRQSGKRQSGKRQSGKRQSGSHRTLSRPGWPDYVFAFHDAEEIGPAMLAKIARQTGLRPENL
jgi:predicted RNA binding protein YcfA (HicA-like mRNA interferase family)